MLMYDEGPCQNRADQSLLQGRFGFQSGNGSMKTELPFRPASSTVLRLLLLTLASVLLSGLFASLAAQTTPKAKASAGAARAVTLDPAAQELADEYSDILERLQDIISDYTDYLSEIGDKDLITSTSFVTFNRAFAAGKYADSSDALKNDLSAYQTKLTSLDQECEKTRSSRSAKACRVVRSLLREINALSNQLSAHTTHIEECAQSEADLKRKMKQITELSQEMAKQYAEIARKAMDKANQELGKTELSFPKAPLGGQSTPRPPVKPTIRVYRPSHTGGPDEVGTQRSANGVITVTSFSIPVVILNPNGSIQITGTSGKTIEASLDFEVSAASLAREKEIVSEIGLKLSGDQGQYRVEVTAPQLSDPKSRLLRNELVVSVPAGLRVQCKGAYGDQSISGLTGPVNASAQYATVDISDCSGGVTVINSMGPVSLSSISGQISVTDSYGDIDISDCRGDMLLMNAYAGIDVSSSRGKIGVQNSGETTVTDHTGPVTIRNQYGEVSVNNVQGDVEIHNAYQSVSVDNVTGRVYVENNYSPIRISSVHGRLKLVNQYATISGEDIRGPFDVIGQGGAIDLELSGPLVGPSTINSTYGAIHLDVGRPSDLLINARTSFGDISSSLPITVNAEGSTKTGVVRIGRGRDSLSIIGTNASIEISGSH